MNKSQHMVPMFHAQLFSCKSDGRRAYKIYVDGYKTRVSWLLQSSIVNTKCFSGVRAYYNTTSHWNIALI